MRVAVLIGEFNEHLADDLDTSPRTAEFYESDLREFARFLEGREVEAIEDLKVGDVMEFRNHLLASQRKSFTVYRKDAAVRRFLNWVRTATDASFDLDPIEPVHQPLDQKITLLENEEVHQLLSFPLRRLDDVRDAAMMSLMLDTGVTVSEIRGVLREDADLEAAQIHLGRPESSHLASRTLGLSEATVTVLRDYLSRRSDETPELVIGRAARPVTTSKSLQNAIHKRCDQVGMWRISPMVLRHTFAVRLLRRGYSLGQLRDALGVRDTTNIGVYKKFV
jgi:integrase/recombinase XerD